MAKGRGLDDVAPLKKSDPGFLILKKKKSGWNSLKAKLLDVRRWINIRFFLAFGT
jgi:hypothetical protein